MKTTFGIFALMITLGIATASASNIMTLKTNTTTICSEPPGGENFPPPTAQ